MRDITRREFVRVIGIGTLMVPTVGLMTACSAESGGGSDDESVVGTWYGVNTYGVISTLEIDESGTWYYNGSTSASGEWSQTDEGLIYLTATLLSLPYEMEGSGDERKLVFAGEDPSKTNNGEIARSTFYANEAARDEAAEELESS